MCVLAHVTLGDGPGIGTLDSSMVGNCGLSTLGNGVSEACGFVASGWSTLDDGMSVASGFDVPW